MSEIDKIKEDWKPLLNNSNLHEKFRNEMFFVLNYISTLEEMVKEFESSLKLNASMLARQCDLAREAESRIKELEEAIRDFLLSCKNEDHGIPQFVLDELQKLLEEKVVGLVDEELYQKRKEVI